MSARQTSVCRHLLRNLPSLSKIDDPPQEESNNEQLKKIKKRMGAIETSAQDGIDKDVAEKIRNLYEKFAPTQLSEVPRLLRLNKGRLSMLLFNTREKFKGKEKRAKEAKEKKIRANGRTDMTEEINGTASIAVQEGSVAVSDQSLRASHESQWPDVPAGWTAAYSEEHNCHYYIHEESGSAQWEHPSTVEMAPYLGASDQNQPEVQGNNITAGSEAIDDLPEGWSVHMDYESGSYYYQNDASGTTQWEYPYDASPVRVTENSVESRSYSRDEDAGETHIEENDLASVALYYRAKNNHSAIERGNDDAAAVGAASLPSLSEGPEDNEDDGEVREGAAGSPRRRRSFH